MSTLDSAVIVVISVLCAVIIYQFVERQLTVNRLEDANNRMCEQWIAERKDLLDRIQAPSFAQYTAKVIGEKKAEQQEEPQENYNDRYES